MPKATLLIGVPGSGKSTWLDNQGFENVYAVGLDIILERIAARDNKTYNEVFKSNIKLADNTFWRGLQDLAMARAEIVVDRTNMSVKSRAPVMTILRNRQYEINAVVFPTPEKVEWERRLSSRPGKTIPPHVLESMANSYQEPTHQEGFRVITFMEN